MALKFGCMWTIFAGAFGARDCFIHSSPTVVRFIRVTAGLYGSENCSRSGKPTVASGRAVQLLY